MRKPNVTFKYYHAKWDTLVTVTQTVGCNADNTHLFTVNTPSITTTYSSNFDKVFEVKIKDLESRFADADMTITYYDDGRLKSINQSTTGQGEMIVKSMIALVKAAGRISVTEKPPETINECKIIESWGADKPVTLIYCVTINSKTLGITVTLDPIQESEDLYDLLKARLPKLEVEISGVKEIGSGPSYRDPSAGDVLLKLQKVGTVNVTVRANDQTIGTANIIIPQIDTYDLPIPKAALFGKQTFTLNLSEAGAVTSIGYVKTAGSVGVMNALSAIAEAKTVATEAADLKAQADLIAQQRRLVLCQTKPDQFE